MPYCPSLSSPQSAPDMLFPLAWLLFFLASDAPPRFQYPIQCTSKQQNLYCVQFQYQWWFGIETNLTLAPPISTSKQTLILFIKKLNHSSQEKKLRNTKTNSKSSLGRAIHGLSDWVGSNGARQARTTKQEVGDGGDTMWRYQWTTKKRRGGGGGGEKWTT